MSGGSFAAERGVPAGKMHCGDRSLRDQNKIRRTRAGRTLDETDRRKREAPTSGRLCTPAADTAGTADRAAAEAALADGAAVPLSGWNVSAGSGRGAEQSHRPGNRANFPQYMELIDRLTKGTAFYRLECNMEPRAAIVAYEGMNS